MRDLEITPAASKYGAQKPTIALMAMLLGLTLAALAVANVNFAGARSLTGPPASLRIRIRMYNPRVIPSKTLDQAEKIAGHILSRAGVEVDWCSVGDEAAGSASPCDPRPRSADFRIHVLTSKPPNFYGDVTGFAVLLPLWEEGESYAGVSYPMIEETAERLDGDLPYVLGATLAHEIGHLLLGAKSHFPSGVMCPRLKPEQLKMAARGELLFTAEQAGRIRDEVARRIGTSPQ